MSEYVLGWVLALERSVLRHATGRRWDPQLDRGVGQLRLGVAGIGSIGAEVVRRAAPFFREIVGLNSDGRAVPGCARCYASGQIADFAAGLDVLVMLLPDTAATTGLVGAEVLAALADGAILINAGRANALVLSDALRALESGGLSAVVLDVFEKEPLADDDPLWSVPGLYITSHTAAPTDTAAIVGLFLDNLERYRGGETLVGRVDFATGYLWIIHVRGAGELAVCCAALLTSAAGDFGRPLEAIRHATPSSPAPFRLALGAIELTLQADAHTAIRMGGDPTIRVLRKGTLAAGRVTALER